MITECKPTNARFWFQWRKPLNIMICFVIFCPVFYLLQLNVGWFLAQVVSISIVFCVYFFALRNRAIGIICQNSDCGKFIETNTPWICNHKGCLNENVDEYPFIHRCQYCGFYPKSYKCHHCQEFTYFTRDEQIAGYAESALYRSNAESVKKRGLHADNVLDRREGIEKKQLDIEEGDLDVKLNKNKELLKTPELKLKKKTSDEELAEFLHGTSEDKIAAQKWRAWVDKEFANDEEERMRMHLKIDEWLRNRIR
jgi:hypothetical protein